MTFDDQISDFNEPELPRAQRRRPFLLLAGAVMALLSIAATTIGNIDYIFGVKNKSEFDVRSYRFTRTNGSGASGTLTTAGAHTAALSPCPAGIAAGSVSHAYVYLSGGAGGAAEAVQISSFSASGANCTIGFTTLNNHTGSWVINSANGGVQEAVMDAGGDSIVHAVAGTYQIQAPIYISTNMTIKGDGRRLTIFQAQGAGIGIIDGNSPHLTVRDLALTSTVQQTSTGYGIRLGVTNVADFNTISNVYCDSVYDCVQSINGEHTDIDHLVAYNFTHDGVLFASATHVDDNGGTVTNSEFFNYTLGTHANAAVEVTSTGSIKVIGNYIGGGGCSQLNRGVHGNYPGGATPVTTGLLVVGNNIQTIDADGVGVYGTFNSVTINGNQFQQGGCLGHGVVMNDGGGTVGVSQATISGNMFQGNTGLSPTYYGVDLEGHTNNIAIGTNSFINCSGAFYIAGNATAITIGPQQLTNTPYLMFSATSGVTLADTFAQSFSNLPGVANGSKLFCTDCKNSVDNAVTVGAVCAGSGAGASAVRINGTWRCF